MVMLIVSAWLAPLHALNNPINKLLPLGPGLLHPAGLTLLRDPQGQRHQARVFGSVLIGLVAAH